MPSNIGQSVSLSDLTPKEKKIIRLALTAQAETYMQLASDRSEVRNNQLRKEANDLLTLAKRFEQ